MYMYAILNPDSPELQYSECTTKGWRDSKSNYSAGADP